MAAALRVPPSNQRARGGVAPVEGGGPGSVPVKVLGGCFPVFDNVVIGGDDVVVEPGDGGGRV